MAMQNAAKEAAAVVGAETAKRNAAMSVGPLGKETQKTLDGSVIAAQKSYAAAKLNVVAANDAYVASAARAKIAGAAESAQTNVLAAANAKLAATKGLVAKASLMVSGGINAAAGSISAFFAALGPVGWTILAVTALAAAFTLMGREAEKAAEKAKKAADEAAAATEKNDAANRKTLDGMKRLQELSGYKNLNANEQKEAKDLLDELGLSYEKHGIRMDEATGRIIAERDALAELVAQRKEDLKQQRIAVLEEEKRKNQAATEATDQKKSGTWGAFWRGIPGISGFVDSVDEIDGQIDDANKALRDRNDKIDQEINGLKNGGVVAGEEKNKRREDNKEQRDARERLEQARYDKNYGESDAEGQARLLEEKKAKLEKELFDKAGNKPESEYSKGELDIAKQIVDLERQRAEIRKKSKDAFRDEEESLARSLEKREDDNARRQTDRDISKIEREQGRDAVKKRLEQELEIARKNAEIQKRAYDEAIRKAEEDGVLTDEERRQIQRARQKLDEAMSDEDTWTNKIADLEAKDQSNAKAAVAYSSEMLSASLGASPTDKAIEKNTKQSVDIQRDSKALLEDIKKKENTTVLK